MNDTGEIKDDPDGTFSASVKLDKFPLVLGDVKASVSVRMGFFLPLGAPFLCDVPCFCPADLGSSLKLV